ncbi:hypothetical protein ACJX0J_015798 [Zea mays]
MQREQEGQLLFAYNDLLPVWSVSSGKHNFRFPNFTFYFFYVFMHREIILLWLYFMPTIALFMPSIDILDPKKEYLVYQRCYPLFLFLIESSKDFLILRLLFDGDNYDFPPNAYLAWCKCLYECFFVDLHLAYDAKWIIFMLHNFVGLVEFL